MVCSLSGKNSVFVLCFVGFNVESCSCFKEEEMQEFVQLNGVKEVSGSVAALTC